MKIVIEIDKKLHGRIFHSDTIYDDDKADVVKAIINGTPLPKHHGDLIDRGALLDKLKGTNRYFNVKYDIEEAPTIIEEVKADAKEPKDDV